jgi:hypothetical protein
MVADPGIPGADHDRKSPVRRKLQETRKPPGGLNHEVRHERGEEFHVGGILQCGAAWKMKDCWPFGSALRREVPNRLLLR